MKVITAKTAGFCFGVHKAVDKAYEMTESGKKIYTYGAIIHNSEVVNELEKKGVTVLEEPNDLEKITDGIVIIRAHGVAKEIIDLLNDKGIEYIDMTCPFVTRIHDIVWEQSKERDIVIIGNPKHPEVEGIVGWSRGRASVMNTKEEVENFVPEDSHPVCVVSQTTFNFNKFKEFVEIFTKKGYDISIVNTICNATIQHQEEAKRIAQEVDLMIVIGDPKSSNSRKLFEICSERCKKTYFVQTAEDLRKRLLPGSGCEGDSLGDELHSFIDTGSVRTVGITAGASTPNYIIEEVQKIMSEETFEQMLEESFKNIHTGDVVEGTVISVTANEIAVNVGYKSDGIVSKNEYSNDNSLDLTTVVKPGDPITVKVIKLNDGDGQVVLSHKRVVAEKVSKILEDAFNEKTVLKAKVTEVVKGGLVATVDEIPVFIPASLVSDTFTKNLGVYADQEIEFVMSEFNPKKRRYIGDARVVLEEKKKAMKEEVLGRIKEGDIVDGVVKNVTNFGAFVDIGGVDGLLHISEMSWGRIETPQNLFRKGDQVRVIIKEIKGEKIALSAKFDDNNPWLKVEENYQPGTIVTGTVARMTDFGAFIQLEDGVDALLHVSQISRKHIEKPSDVLRVGDTVEAMITDVNAAEHKISLSIKELSQDADDDQDGAAEGSEE